MTFLRLYSAEFPILCRQTIRRRNGPVLGADPSRGVKEPIRVISVLDRQKSVVIRSPERVLEIWLLNVGLSCCQLKIARDYQLHKYGTVGLTSPRYDPEPGVMAL